MGHNDNVDNMYGLRKRIISSNEQNYREMLAKLDKIGISCCVCKTPLKRVKPSNEAVSVVNVQPWEVIYACKNGHIFSGDVLIYLYLTDEF